MTTPFGSGLTPAGQRRAAERRMNVIAAVAAMRAAREAITRTANPGLPPPPGMDPMAMGAGMDPAAAAGALGAPPATAAPPPIPATPSGMAAPVAPAVAPAGAMSAPPAPATMGIGSLAQQFGYGGDGGGAAPSPYAEGGVVSTAAPTAAPMMDETDDPAPLRASDLMAAYVTGITGGRPVSEWMAEQGMVQSDMAGGISGPAPAMSEPQPAAADQEAILARMRTPAPPAFLRWLDAADPDNLGSETAADLVTAYREGTDPDALFGVLRGLVSQGEALPENLARMSGAKKAAKKG